MTLDPSPPDRGSTLVAKLKGEYHRPDSQLVLHLVQELHYLIGNWQIELDRLQRDIDTVHQSGPIIAGWMEPAAPGSPDPIPEPINYQLCSLDETGQVWARDCAETELYGVSKAIARHRQLRTLLDRQGALEANLKHTLACLVQLRMDLQV